MAAQAFEAWYFLKIFLWFWGFWGSFSYKRFSYKKACNLGKRFPMISFFISSKEWYDTDQKTLANEKM